MCDETNDTSLAFFDRQAEGASVEEALKRSQKLLEHSGIILVNKRENHAPFTNIHSGFALPLNQMAGEGDFNLPDPRSGAENTAEEGAMEEKLKVSGFESSGNQVKSKKAGSKHKPAGNNNKSSKPRSGNKRAPETVTENSSAVFKKRRSGFEERSGSDLEGGNGGLKEKISDGKSVVDIPSKKAEKDKYPEGVVGEEDWFGDKRDLRPRRKSLSNLLLRDIKLTEADARRIIGRRIKVFWPLDDDWYFGRVESFDGNRKRHHVVYEDGDEEWLELGKEKFKIQLYPGDVFGKTGSVARPEKLEAQRVDLHKKNGRKRTVKPLGKKNGRKGTDGPVKKRNGRNRTDALADDRKRKKGGPADDRKEKEGEGKREEDGKDNDTGEDENRPAKEKDGEDAKNPVSLRQMLADDTKKKKGLVDHRKGKEGKGKKEEDGKNDDIGEDENRAAKEKDDEDAKKPLRLRQMLADDRKKKKGGLVDDRKGKEAKGKQQEEDGKSNDIGEDKNQPAKEKNIEDAQKPTRQTAPRSKRARSTKQYNQKPLGQNQTEVVNVTERSVEDTGKQDVDSEVKVEEKAACVGFCRGDDTDDTGGGRQHYGKQVDDLLGNGVEAGDGGIPEVQQSDLSKETKMSHIYEKDLHQSKEVDEIESEKELQQTRALDENEPSVIQSDQLDHNQTAERQHSSQSDQLDERKMILETRPKLTNQLDRQQSDIRGCDETVDEKRSSGKGNDEKGDQRPAHLDLASELGQQKGIKRQRSRVKVRTRDSILAQASQSTVNVEGQSAGRQYLQFSPSREGQPANRNSNLQ